MIRNEDELKQAVEDLGIDTGPRPGHREALRRQMLEAFEQAASREPAPVTARIGSWIGRATMNRTFRQTAGIAAVVIISLSGFFWWNTRHAGVAFGQVVDFFEQVNGGRLTLTLKDADGQVTQTARMEILGQRLRWEGDDNVGICDMAQGKILVLSDAEKIAVTLDLGSLPKEFEGFSRNWLMELREGVLSTGDRAKEIGSRQIAGRQAKGFQSLCRGRAASLWVDAETAVPIEIECRAGDGEWTIVLSDFEFGAALDESRFSLTPPPGYIGMGMGMNLASLNDQDLVNLLDEATKANGGRFPERLDQEHLLDYLDVLEEENDLSLSQAWGMVGAGMRGAFFVALARDWHYAGAGVTRGEADKAVFWHRPRGSKMYRVIYGDLSVKDVALQDLPEKKPRGG